MHRVKSKMPHLKVMISTQIALKASKPVTSTQYPHSLDSCWGHRLDHFTIFVETGWGWVMALK